MQKINFNVQEPYYSFLLSGQKTIEGRLNKGKFAKLKSGDVLLLAPQDIPFKVVDIKIYKTFAEMLEKEGIQRVIPDKTSVSEAVATYHSFYTPNDEKQFGVITIFLERLTK
ncbi:MAG: ASCH domain-containing protein [Patescibacteria group bacterium]